MILIHCIFQFIEPFQDRTDEVSLRRTVFIFANHISHSTFLPLTRTTNDLALKSQRLINPASTLRYKVYYICHFMQKTILTVLNLKLKGVSIKAIKDQKEV